MSPVLHVARALLPGRISDPRPLLQPLTNAHGCGCFTSSLPEAY